MAVGLRILQLLLTALATGVHGLSTLVTRPAVLPHASRVTTATTPLTAARVTPTATPLTAARASATRAHVSAPRAPSPRAAEGEEPERKLPWLLDISTKGGIIFYSIIGIVLPFFVYNFLLDTLGMDVVSAGNVVLVGYVGLATIGWTASYVFRVANKDMTYAKQLRDYENAVIQKRFEELNTDEVDALMTEIYPDKQQPPAGEKSVAPPAEK